MLMTHHPLMGDMVNELGLLKSISTVSLDVLATDLTSSKEIHFSLSGWI